MASFLRKQAPLWSILLTILASAGAVTVAFMAVPQLSDAAQSMRDFSITANPSPVTMQPGTSATSTITVTSENSFNVATALTTSIPQSSTIYLTTTLSLAVITPPSNGKSDTTLTITTIPGTPAGDYQLTLTATGGTKTHTTTLTIAVTQGPGPDFIISPNPASFIVQQANSNTTTLTLTSLDTFTGDVSLIATAPFGIGVYGQTSPVHLSSGGTNTTLLYVLAGPTTALGTYTVTVTATSGPILHVLALQITVKASSGCGPPMCGTEALSLEASAFNSGTNVTLYIRNTGASSISMVSYYVKDASNNQYSYASWNGPTVAPNAVAVTIILIGSSCPNCVLSGTAFTFTSGNSYTVTIVTARNNQFTFTITR